MNVTFYSTHCPKCKVLKLKLKQKNIEYTENDKVDEMLALGIQSAPALSVDGQIYLFADAIKWVNKQEVSK